MSFFTSLIFYRPRTPPLLTANDLAQFVARLRDTTLLVDGGLRSLKIKFGDAVDQDDKSTTWNEPLGGGRLFVAREIEWDQHLSDPTIAEMVECLTGDGRRIYRAWISIGALSDEVLQPITRLNSPENDRDFCPDGLSLEVGPIEIYSLGTELIAHVGWIGLSISGSGYLFPWTIQEVVERAATAPAIQRLTDVCRASWPVTPERPEPRIAEARKQLGELWPYADLHKTWDWYWGVCETG